MGGIVGQYGHMRKYANYIVRVRVQAQGFDLSVRAI